MKFTLSWLKEHLETNASVNEIAERLTMIGLEIEEVINPAAALKGFVVAEIISADKHPDADRLQLLSVNTGSETIPIVCGAKNARQGLKGVLASPGLVIPCYNEKFKKGKIRGVESMGMLCSEKELLIGDGDSGIIELPENAVVGSPATDYLSVDTVFDIVITPNRGDCLGVRGVARDLAASGMGKLIDKPIEPVSGTFKSPISVNIALEPENKDACPMFVGRMIKNVENKESPKWLKDKLTAIGLSPVSALVDITNFISYDKNRPLHVFDADKLEGNLHVRLAKDGETMLALDEKEYKFTPEMIVVCDDKCPQALGGVMGGEHSACTSETKNVFIESALFETGRIANTGRKLQIESDSRFRFERWVDPASAIDGAEYATKLIMELCGGESSELVIAGSEPDMKQSIVFRPERVKQLCAVDIPVENMKQILEHLGFEVGEHGDALLVSTPTWRGDVEGEHDLVEEIVRIYGYDKIPTISPPREPMPKVVRTLRQRNEISARRTLAGRGMLEAVTWAFMSSAKTDLFKTSENADKKVLLANPISSDLDEMRPSLLPNLIDAAGRNASRGFADISLFEIGPEFIGSEPSEQRMVAAGLRAGYTTPRNWSGAQRTVDVFDAKADALATLAAISAPISAQVTNKAPSWYHPGRSGSLSLGKNVLAYFGEIHPRVLKKMNIKTPMVGFEVYIENAPAKEKKQPKTRTLLKSSAFQPVNRDFAFVVNADVQAADVIKAAKNADKKLISDVLIFDSYEGSNMEAGKKSLAVQITLQPTEKTLTDKDLEIVTKAIISSVAKATGGELRA